MANVHFYRCFSLNQMRWLKACGQSYLYTKQHKDTGRTYFVYQETEELSELLTMWTNNKPK